MVLTLQLLCAVLGNVWAWGSGLGQVGFGSEFGVQTDLALASGSLCRLVFCVQYFSHGQRAHHEERRQGKQQGKRTTSAKGMDYTAMLFDN